MRFEDIIKAIKLFDEATGYENSRRSENSVNSVGYDNSVQFGDSRHIT